MPLFAGAAWLNAGSAAARPASQSQLQQQLTTGQGRVSSLSGTVAAQSRRIGQLGGAISATEGQIAALQARIGPEVARLLKLRAELTRAQRQLGYLEGLQSNAEGALAKQLVTNYESGHPDLVTVVIDSHGFRDLLEQATFAQHIQHEETLVVGSVRATRRAVAAQATRLGGLEAAQQRTTSAVLEQRNQLVHDRLGLVSEQLAVARTRAQSARQLAAAQAQVSGLRAQLSQIEAAQARAAARAAGLSGGAQVTSAGGFTFPLPKGAAGAPGSWSPDDGVDITAPGGTPELAVCSGTIVLHGIGGFGPWAPVLHCDSQLGGYSYVYYGHAGPANELPIGTHVSAGQVIAEVGPGIVGISSGPHLELGFCDSSGAPIGPQSAGQMLSLLQAAYAG